MAASSLLANIDTQHEDQIHDCQFDFYGTRLATASSDKSIRIFEVNGDKTTLQHKIQAHESAVWQLSWADPKYGSLLASASFDKRVLLHQEGIDGQWRVVYSFEDNKTSVNCVQFAPPEYGLILACGSSDGQVTVLESKNQTGNDWEVTAKFSALKSGVSSLSWAPPAENGSLFDEPNTVTKKEIRKRLVCSGNNSTIHIYEEEEFGSWKLCKELDGHKDWVRCVAWAPSTGRNKNIIASCDHHGEVRIWTKETGADWEHVILQKYNYPIWDVSWSVTGNLLSVSGGDNNVTVWRQMADGEWACILDQGEQGN